MCQRKNQKSAGNVKFGCFSEPRNRGNRESEGSYEQDFDRQSAEKIKRGNDFPGRRTRTCGGCGFRFRRGSGMRDADASASAAVRGIPASGRYGGAGHERCGADGDGGNSGKRRTCRTVRISGGSGGMEFLRLHRGAVCRADLRAGMNRCGNFSC